MAPAMRSSTPPPSTRLHTPPTPKHGFSDHWEPYSPPRKSARISAQHTTNRTPPPRNSFSNTDPFGPAKTTRAQPSSSAGMVSPFPSPTKKSRMSSAMDWDDSTETAGRLSAHGASKAASSLSQDDKTTTSTCQTASATISRTTGMLPTPAKTPKKAPTKKNPAIQAIARNLFASDDEIMPSPRKARAKKYTGISLDSFRAEEDPIEIFTDSKERVPSKEVSADNPFYGEQVHAKPAAPGGQESRLRRSKRRHVHVPGEGRQTVEEAMQREDGLVYVFRGKKVFRKFADTEALDEEDDGPEDGSESPVHGHMTRSSIKPRLLFPSKPRSEAALEDEEADTDIDDDANARSAEHTDTPETPAVESKVTTPNAPGYSPVSPPDTRRATRTRDKKLDEGTPVKPKGRTSPFDSWPRVKSRSDSGVSSKRAGSSLSSATTKKARS